MIFHYEIKTAVSGNGYIMEKLDMKTIYFKPKLHHLGSQSNKI